MAFAMPDLKALAQKARNAFTSEMPGIDSWVWPNNIYVAAKVFAGILYELFLRLRWIDKQRFAMTATLEGLLMMGEEYGIPLNSATRAQGYVDVPAVYPFVVPVGTVFIRPSDDTHYVSTQEVSALQYGGATSVSVPVVCQTIGKTGNMLAGASLETNLFGLTDQTTVATVSSSGIGQGADVEDVESYRQRILTRKRQVPMGGCEYDYEAWVREVPGVTRVFVRGKAFGPGTVGVWFLMDGTYTAGIPQQSDVQAVQSYLDVKAPVTANVSVYAPVADLLDITVKGITPDTTQVRQAVAAELLALFENMVTPGLPGMPFTLRHSWIEKAVSNATGVQYFEKVLAPGTDLQFLTGVIPVLRSVKFS